MTEQGAKRPSRQHEARVIEYPVYVVRCSRGCASMEYRFAHEADEAARTHNVGFHFCDDCNGIDAESCINCPTVEKGSDR